MKVSRTIMKVVLVVLGMATLVESAFAGSGRRSGTAGAQELLIPVGAVGMGLAGSNTAIVNGVNALYWNPAGAATLTNSTEALFSHMNYMAVINVEYAAFATKLGEESGIGLSIQTMDFGDIPVTTVDLPDGTGEMYSPTFLTLGATYSQKMTDRISFGATAKIISEQILRQSATGVAFDFGLQYQTGITGFQFGVVLKNLGTSMAFEGPDLEKSVIVPGSEPGTPGEPLSINAQAFDLPSTLEFGASYSAALQEDVKAVVTGLFEHQNFSYDNFKIGAEIGYQNLLYLRGGYLFSPDTPVDDQIYSYSIGGGVNLQLSTSLNVTIDYAYRAVDLFGDNQVFSVTVGI